MKKYFKKYKNIFVFFPCIFFFLLLFLFPTNAQTEDVVSEKVGEYVEGEVLVKYKKERVNLETSSGRSKARGIASDASMRKKEDLAKGNISVFEIRDGKSVEEKIVELEKDPDVEYAEPNYKRYLATINTNDTHKLDLWGLHNYGQSVNGTSGTVDADIDAPEAWALYDESGVGQTIIVAVIDDGVAYNHPDLINKMWDGSACKNNEGNSLGGCIHGYDYADDDKNPLPNGSHGTHVAGIIGAEKNNGIGVIGVAPNVKIMALRFGFTVLSEIKAIDFAIQNGAKIINASYGGYGYSSFERDAIIRFRNSGGIFVAAAGNDTSNNNSSPSFYPASHNLDNIISVAATNQNDGLASFSNYGSTSVHVGAPGTNVYSTRLFTTFEEDFNSLTPPSIGNKFTQSGKDSTWGTLLLGSSGMVIAADGSNWSSYRNNIESNLDTIAIDLTGRPDSYLGFYIQCETVAGDGVELYFGKGSTWDEDELAFYSGSGYSDAQIPIPSEYIVSDFQVRFKWVTGAGAVGPNNRPCFLDDVRVIDGSSGSATGTYMFASGTSMAAPYVSGLAALLWGANPDLSLAEVRNSIINDGDSLSSLADKTISGKRINAHTSFSETYLLRTVTYNANGGTCTPSSRTVNYGSSSAGPSCTRIGYTLSNFSITSGSCAGTFNSSTGACSNVQGNMTIRANWNRLPLLYQSHVGTDRTIYTRRSVDGISWTNWGRSNYPGEATNHAVSLASHGNYLYQSHVGTDRTIYTRRSTDGVSWTNWGRSNYPSEATNHAVSLASHGNYLYQSHVGTDRTIYTRRSTDGVSWTNWSRSNYSGEATNYPVSISAF